MNGRASQPPPNYAGSFPLGFFLAQLTRQWTYELATVGHLTGVAYSVAAAIVIAAGTFLGYTYRADRQINRPRL